jgi:hypothetical protein
MHPLGTFERRDERDEAVTGMFQKQNESDQSIRTCIPASSHH